MLFSFLRIPVLCLLLLCMGAWPDVSSAGEKAPSLHFSETSYLFTSLLFMLTGLLAMLSIIGFSLQEAAAIKPQNVGVILIKNIALFSFISVMFYLTGYSLAYVGVPEDGYMGTLGIWERIDDAVMQGRHFDAGYSASSDWFFQLMFPLVAAFIISGTVGVRAKIWPLLLFMLLFGGIIYPLIASWQWGGGWMKTMGFSDFAGGTLVHVAGGCAALMITLLLGPRQKRFSGQFDTVPNLGFSALGAFILWLAFLALHGGSHLIFANGIDAVAVSNVITNTHLAACGSVIAVVFINQIFFEKIRLHLIIRAVIAGIVSIAADPLTPAPWLALVIGTTGGVVMVLVTSLMDSAKIDDVCGNIPVHFACGIWGTMAVPFSATGTSFVGQFFGLLSVLVCVSLATGIYWLLAKLVFGIKVEKESDLLM